MGKKQYTVLVFSQQAARVKKFILSPLALKGAVTALVLLLTVSGYLVYDYVSYQKKILDLKELRSELNSQQAEIQSFLEKISLLEEQLSRLKMVEEQVKKDFREVQDLKKEKKVKKLSPPPGVSLKKPLQLPRPSEPKHSRPILRERRSPSWRRKGPGWSAVCNGTHGAFQRKPSRGSKL